MNLILLLTLYSAALMAQDYSEVEKVLLNKCVSCHSIDNSHGGVVLDNYESVMENVTPGSLNDSSLWIAVASGMMPMGNTMTQAERKIIRTWIQSGAKNKNSINLSEEN